MGYRPGRKLRAPWRDRVSTPVSSWLNFTPLSLQPDLWLDASDSSTITAVSGSVSQWDDKSGNARHFTQATGSAQPITGTRTLNGLNVIDFNGTTMVMGGGDILDLGTGNITVAAVVKIDNAGNSHTILGKYKVSPLAGSWLLLRENTQNNFIYTRLNSTNVVSTLVDQDVTNATSFIGILNRDNGEVNSLFKNFYGSRATFTPDTATNQNNATGAWLGALRNSTDNGFFANYWIDGYIAEIIVCLRTLTFGEINAIRNYFKQKWSAFV